MIPTTLVNSLSLYIAFSWEYSVTRLSIIYLFLFPQFKLFLYFFHSATALIVDRTQEG